MAYRSNSPCSDNLGLRYKHYSAMLLTMIIFIEVPSKGSLTLHQTRIVRASVPIQCDVGGRAMIKMVNIGRCIYINSTDG